MDKYEGCVPFVGFVSDTCTVKFRSNFELRRMTYMGLDLVDKLIVETVQICTFSAFSQNIGNSLPQDFSLGNFLIQNCRHVVGVGVLLGVGVLYCDDVVRPCVLFICVFCVCEFWNSGRNPGEDIER